MSTSRVREGEYKPLAFASDAVAERAERLRREGRHFAAALEWQALVRLDPRDGQAALRWADACIRSDQRARAAEAYLAAATAFARGGQARRAMLLARRAAELEPAEILRARIDHLVRVCGRQGEALCEDAARAHVAAGRFDSARELRELLVECDPGSVTKTLLAAELELGHGDPSRGAGQLAEAAMRMHATGRTGEYVRLAETMIAHGRLDADTMLELARIYLRRGEARDAVAKLELLRRQCPGRLEVVELLVRCYAAHGDTAAALAVLADAIARRGRDEGATAALCERACAFVSLDPGFAAAVRRLIAQPRAVRRGPPPPPRWAGGGRVAANEAPVRAPSESSGIGWPHP